MNIQLITASQTVLQEGLISLLQDAVDSGASVGFLAPLSVPAARQYWQKVYASLHGERYLWVAIQGAELVGCVQLVLATQENAAHRAEIQKLLVLSRYRGQGFARKLMVAAQAKAAELGRNLLVLDTQTDSAAQAVYLRMGWRPAGQIPNYAACAQGELKPTTLFYKML